MNVSIYYIGMGIIVSLWIILLLLRKGLSSVVEYILLGLSVLVLLLSLYVMIRGFNSYNILVSSLYISLLSLVAYYSISNYGTYGNIVNVAKILLLISGIGSLVLFVLLSLQYFGILS